MRLQSFPIAAVLATAMAAALAAPAGAASPKVLGTFGQWTAYSFLEKGGEVCYMAAQPRKAEGNYRSRGDIFALITHRPKEKSFNVFSIVAGYPYKKDSKVSVKIGRKTYDLFTQGERAWAMDEAADKALTTLVRRGSAMVVKGVSTRGTLTTDTYGLSGSSAAYKVISEACGLKID